MGQHRKRPASRHQWRIRGRRTQSPEPRETNIASAVRRVIVTPTFAAGLGVVVAAMLAFQMGVPSFRVSVPRWTGQRCTTPACVTTPGNAGTATVKGGQPLQAPVPAVTASSGPVSRGANGAASPPGAQAVVAYQTEASWPGGFEGHLTISLAGGQVPSHWRLRFSYPSGQIQRVWGSVSWQPKGAHIAVVAAPHSDEPGASGQDIQVWFQVTGNAGKPHGCTFNRVACRFR